MIKDKINQLRQRIEIAATRRGIDPGRVTLIAVTKTFPVEALLDAVACGIRDVAESRVQEAQEKFLSLDRVACNVTTHLIGHLQTNKVKRALELFDVIQSLDSSRLAEEINRQARIAGKIQSCLVQVKVSEEESKYGLPPHEVPAFIEQCAILPNLQVHGLMAMAPYNADAEQARPYFHSAHDIFDSLRASGALPATAALSMGMSHDFDVAVEEGATMVRIGTALFGDR
jgi:pyridoxal phosphate enzyme (YggS family)